MHEVQDRTWSVERYERPGTLTEAVELLDRFGDKARIVAGATDLLLEMQRGVRDVDVMIDLSAIDGLDTVTIHDGVVSLGPLTTHRMVVESPTIVAHGLPLAQASLEVGSAQLRNRATVAGNLITASPANDTISSLLALGASVDLASVSGTRQVALTDFYTGVRRTVMAPNELMIAIHFPAMRDSEVGVFAKVGLRSAQAISVVHAATVLALDEGVVTAARIALGSVAPTVVLVQAADALLGTELDGSLSAHSKPPMKSIRSATSARQPPTARTWSVSPLPGCSLQSAMGNRLRSGLPGSSPCLMDEADHHRRRSLPGQQTRSSSRSTGRPSQAPTQPERRCSTGSARTQHATTGRP